MLILKKIFLFLFLTSSVFAQNEKEPSTVIEEETEIVFPSYIKLPIKTVDGRAADIQYDLIGVGVREKYWIDVYGFGFYINVKAAMPLIMRALKSSKSMKPDEAKLIWESVMLNKRFSKLMRWVMARNIDGEDISEAFEDSLAPSIKVFHKEDEEKLKKSLSAMAKLRGWFEKTDLPEGAEILFVWSNDSLEVLLRKSTELKERTSLGIINDLGVCSSLFALFLGEEPIDEEAKERFLLKFKELSGESGDLSTREKSEKE